MRSMTIMIAAVAAIAIQIPSLACTSIIVSGKAIPDGRSLMWKNRDTCVLENHVQHFPSENGRGHVRFMEAESSAQVVG